MAMEERTWRKEGLERAAEICEEMAETWDQEREVAHSAGMRGVLAALTERAEALREAAARIRGEG